MPATTLAYTDEEIDAKLKSLQDIASSSAPKFSVNGYATFATSRTDERDGTYNDVSSDEWNFEALSRAAVQLEFRVNEDTRLVTQLLSRGDQGWQTHAEWAFIAHSLSPSTTVRAGRLRLPIFLYSETLDVGYTQPWVTTPTEIYTLQFSSYEGADLRYSFDGLGADWTLQPYFGAARLDRWEGVESQARGKNMHGIDITANWENVTARIGYFGSQLDIPSFPLADVAYGLNDAIRLPIAEAVGAAAAAAAACGINGTPGAACPASVYTPAYNGDSQNPAVKAAYNGAYNGILAALPQPNLDVHNADTQFVSVGLRYDDGRLLLLTEYAGSKIDGYFTDMTNCYGTIGYRIGPFMPTVTWANARSDDPEDRKFAPYSYDPDLAGPAPAIVLPNLAGTLISSAFALDQQSTTLGLRYDPRPGVALKAEASLVGEFARGSSGQWIPDNSPAPAPDEFWVYRASVDVVF